MPKKIRIGIFCHLNWSTQSILNDLPSEEKFTVQLASVAIRKLVSNRVAKCHGYGGYIRVKKLEVWGKKFERIHRFAKSSIVWGKFDQLI